MSVVGIDLGNLNTVVAVARNRGIDVIVNEASNRATPSLVSFGEKQRFLGEAAKNMEVASFYIRYYYPNLKVSNFKNTVGNLKRMLTKSNDPQIAYEKPFLSASLASVDGEAAANVQFQGEEHTYTFTQLCAMLLVKVKDFTSLELKAPVSDCVISCPTWFTVIQRRALLDAAAVSGLNVLKLMNDTTASALGYGITRTDLPDSANNEPPRNVCFVDLGHSSYQVSFVKGKLMIKGTSCDPNLGGRDYDQVLVKHYSEEFKKKFKIDIASNAKATFRLRQGVERAKKILSANPSAPLNIECIMEDTDVSATVNREEFLELARPISERLLKPINDALAAAGMSPNDIHFVELIGGSTRLPVVKETLATYFGGSLDGENKLSTTLNQDEAVARGCALQCAILSPVFKVRDFEVQDWNGMAMELNWDPKDVPVPKNGDGAITTMEAFSLGNAIPSSKILTFYRDIKPEELAAGTNDVSFVIHGKYTGGQDIGSWKINGIKQFPSTETKDADGNVLSAKGNIKIKVKLDVNCLLAIESAVQTEDVIVPDESEENKEGKTKRVINRHDLVVVPNLSGASKDVMQTWLADEGAMYASDRLVIDTADKRNALEEYVYETRSKLEMAWTEFVIDSERVTFMKSLNEMEDWLYGEEGESATKSLFVEKLESLTNIGHPIALRAHQFEERPLAEKEFRNYVSSVLVEIGMDDPKYAHIEKTEMEKVKDECTKKLGWLDTELARQNALSRHVDPVLTSDIIRKEKDVLYYFVTPILNKPKPKPVVVETSASPAEKKSEAKTENKKEVNADSKEKEKGNATKADEVVEPVAEMEVD